MIRTSNHHRDALLRDIGAGMPRMQAATAQLDEAAGAYLGVNATDLRVLEVLEHAGPSSPSALADATKLSRGAMTTALDRLSAKKLVRRVGDVDDRRSVRVELTTKAIDAIALIWGAMVQEGVHLFDDFTDDELAAVARAIRGSIAVQEKHAERVRALRVRGRR